MKHTTLSKQLDQYLTLRLRFLQRRFLGEHKELTPQFAIFELERQRQLLVDVLKKQATSNETSIAITTLSKQELSQIGLYSQHIVFFRNYLNHGLSTAFHGRSASFSDEALFCTLLKPIELHLQELNQLAPQTDPESDKRKLELVTHLLDTHEVTNIYLHSELTELRANTLIYQWIGGIDTDLSQALDSCHHCLMIFTPDNYPWEHAKTLIDLGLLWVQSASAGAYERSLSYLTQALHTLSFTLFPYDHAKTHCFLGHIWSLASESQCALKCEKSIEHFEYALQTQSFETYPLDYASVCNKLGVAYSELKELHATHIEKAITYYKNALDVFTRQAFPRECAMIHSNLISAFLNRTAGERSANIEEAVHHGNLALQVSASTERSAEWADIHYNLGIAYMERIEGNRATNIEESIYHLSLAEAGYQPDTHKLQWGNLKNSLGNAYAQRIQGAQHINIEKSKAFFYEAFTAFSAIGSIPKSAMVHNNLANTLVREYKSVRKSPDLLAEAITHYFQSLEVYTRELDPCKWADVHKNLAYLFHEQGHLDKAIKHYRTALEVYTREFNQFEWATLCYHMSLSLYESQQYDEAEQTMTEALPLFPPDRFLYDYFEMGLLMIRIALKRERYQEALQWCELIRNNEQRLYQRNLSVYGRLDSIRKSTTYFSLYAFTLIRLDRIHEAIEIMDSGRARFINGMLERDAFVVNERLRPLDRQRLDELRCQLLNLEYEEQSAENVLNAANRTHRAILNDLQVLYGQLDALLRSVRVYEPDFMLSGSDYAQIQALIPDSETGIMMFNFTEFGSDVVLLYKENKADQDQKPMNAASDQSFRLMTEAAISIPDFTDRDLHDAFQLYYRVYNAFRESPHMLFFQKKFNNALRNLCTRLYQRFFIQVDKRLRKLHLTRLVFVPHKELTMLPLQLLFEITQPDQLNDSHMQYDVSYLPSLNTLKQLTQRAETGSGSRADVLSLINPGGDLTITELVWHSLEKIPMHSERLQRLPREECSKELIQKYSNAISDFLFFGHGEANLEVPLQSYLNLSSNPSPEDSTKNQPFSQSDATIWYCRDILKNFRLIPGGLALIAGCETGVHNPERLADEFLNIGACFLAIGANQAIVSLWNVEVAATVLLFMDFLNRYYGSGIPAHQALHEAQTVLRSLSVIEAKRALLNVSGTESPDLTALIDCYFEGKDPYPFAEPYYWSSFILVGWGA